MGFAASRTPNACASSVTTRSIRCAAGWQASRPDLAVSPHDVLVARQLLDTDGSPCVEAIGRNADLRTHAELATVGELRRCVVQDDRAVDAREKALGGCGIAGHDRFRV